MSEELAELLQKKGISHLEVLNAMASVPRHKFVSPTLQAVADIDEPLTIGHGQTISQPYVVARMTELLLQNHAGPIRKILEIGTGSGYQAAILSLLVEKVYTVERIKPLYDQAVLRFEQLGYKNIHVLYGDGRLGWAEHSPYQAIIVTAGTTSVPHRLIDQLDAEGCLLIPLQSGYYHHELCLLTKKNRGTTKRFFDQVLFVPLKSGTE